MVPDLGRPRLALAVWLAMLAFLAVGIALVGGAPSSPPPILAERGVFTPTGQMAESREQPTLTVLADGRVLVVAGWPTQTSAEVWDPATGLFTPVGEMAVARWGQTATLLDDGRVLVAGGSELDTVVPAEVWDPRTSSFTVTGTPLSPRFHGASELRADGRVLIMGGSNAPVAHEVWDPDTGTFTPAEPTPGTVGPEGTLLDDGRILVVDGRSARVWDPTTGATSPAGMLVRTHGSGPTLTRLQDGRVLVAGGWPPDGDVLDSAEIWDPSTLTSTPTGSLTRARSSHAAVLLDDGRVLVVGSRYRSGYTGKTAELFELR
jgi:hypothetical protein